MAASLLMDVRPRAQAALANSPFYELHDLCVEHRDGALTISGTVTSFYHKQLAQEVVRSVCKEIEIVNSIHVSDEVGVGLND
jgi:osmotically-inducible protein OsmY